MQHAKKRKLCKQNQGQGTKIYKREKMKIAV